MIHFYNKYTIKLKEKFRHQTGSIKLWMSSIVWVFFLSSSTHPPTGCSDGRPSLSL